MTKRLNKMIKYSKKTIRARKSHDCVCKKHPTPRSSLWYFIYFTTINTSSITVRLLIVEYLKTCTSPLVNPIIGNYVRPPTPVDDEFPSASSPLSAGSLTRITDSPVKSENKNDFNLENILKS